MTIKRTNLPSFKKNAEIQLFQELCRNMVV